MTAETGAGAEVGQLPRLTVLVLGSSGTAGRRTVTELVRSGHHVRAHVRSDKHVRLWPPRDVEVVRGDASLSQVARELVRGVDAVIDLRVHVPTATRAAAPGAWHEYVETRDRLTGVVVDAAVAEEIPRVVHDTVTMVYADGGDEVLDEESPVEADGPLSANLAAEEHLDRFTASGGTGVALRFANFYSGYDPFSIEVMREARKGHSLYVGHDDAWHSAIHVDDVARALVHALEVPAGVYNVADDEPMRRRDLAALLAEDAGVDRLREPATWTLPFLPAPMRALARSHRVSAERFKSLGWAPTIPTRRTGWPRAFEGTA